MQDLSEFRIEVMGQMDVNAFNRTSPLRIADVEARVSATAFSIYTDQSGLIGLIRHLHWQGYVLCSVNRQRE